VFTWIIFIRPTYGLSLPTKTWSRQAEIIWTLPHIKRHVNFYREITGRRGHKKAWRLGNRAHYRSNSYCIDVLPHVMKDWQVYQGWWIHSLNNKAPIKINYKKISFAVNTHKRNFWNNWFWAKQYKKHTMLVSNLLNLYKLNYS
jgi:hypothetical protein